MESMHRKPPPLPHRRPRHYHYHYHYHYRGRCPKTQPAKRSDIQFSCMRKRAKPELPERRGGDLGKQTGTGTRKGQLSRATRQGRRYCPLLLLPLPPLLLLQRGAAVRCATVS
jgi:hypothetical protein